jgi:hypothetical protein
MSEKLKVLHFFSSQSRVHFTRALLSPQNTKIDYYIATPFEAFPVSAYTSKKGTNKVLERKCFKVIAEKLCFSDIINNHLTFNGKVIYYKTLKSLGIAIKHIKFDSVLVSDLPTFDTIIKIYLICNYLPNIYFVAHGITFYELRQSSFSKWNPYITFFSAGKYQVSGLQKPTEFYNETYKRRVLNINGLPQFDYLMMSNEYYKNKTNQIKIRDELNIPIDSKFILLIIGIDCNIEGIVLLMNVIHKCCPNHFIVLRNKMCNFELPAIFKPFVRMTLLSRVLYDYLFSDINIVYIGGTSHIEALMVNPKTILYQGDNIVSHNEQLIVTDYKYLLISNSHSELESQLSFVNTNYIDGIEYKKEVKEFIHNLCGDISFVSDNIIKQLYTDKTNSFYNKELSEKIIMRINKVRLTIPLTGKARLKQIERIKTRKKLK